MDSIPRLELDVKDRSQAATVLLLEQEDSLRRVIVLTLKQMGMKVLEASDAPSARKYLKNHNPDLFVLNFDHPSGKNGNLINLYREKTGVDQGGVLLTTTQRPDDNWRELYKPDIVVYKPFDIRYLVKRITTLT
ncbi:MAG: response regulator [Anaerolineales bacterium]|jgi:DNA-binding response OmpR family regulator